MKVTFKITKSKTINKILLLNFAILLVFAVFITMNSLVFSAENGKMKNQRVNRDNLFLSYVYQNLYTDVNNCFSEYKYSDELNLTAYDPESMENTALFLRKLLNLNYSLENCYILYESSDRIVSGGGVLTRQAFFHNLTIKDKDDFDRGLYTDGNIRVFQAVHDFNSRLTGLTMFVTAYNNTAMILTYSTQTLNELVADSISEPGNQATLLMDSEIVCSTFSTSVDENAAVSVAQTDMSEYLPLFSPIHGTDFHIVYYKFIGGYDQINRNIALISIVFLIMLLLMDLIIYYIIRKSFYNPVKKILNKHSEALPAGTVNEYAVLDTLFSDLQEKYTRSLNVEESLKYENSFIRLFTGNAHTPLEDATVSYDRFIMIKLVFDNGKSNASSYQYFETALSQSYVYKRIPVSDKLSYFILDAGGVRPPLNFTELTEPDAFYLAGISEISEDSSLQLSMKQCEKAFACAGRENRAVFYMENLKAPKTINVSQETLNGLLNCVVYGNVSAVAETLDGVFDSNRNASIGQMKAVCNCLADMLHMVSINTNTLIDSFQNFYIIRDTFNFDTLHETVCTLYREVASSNLEKSDDRILDIVKCVDEEYHTQISLQALSDRFNLPVDQISKLFKRQVGVNFVNYKQQKRIEKAKEMLMAGKSVNEICQYIGFANASTFIKLFEKSVGITPGKYRQTLTDRTNP